MLEGTDFQILEDKYDEEQGKLAPVRILSGKYAGVEYTYGVVQADQHPEKGAVLQLKFQYAVIDDNGLDVDTEEFVGDIGQILNKIILDRYFNGQFVKIGESNGTRQRV